MPEDSFELWLNPSDGDVRFGITNPSNGACEAVLRLHLVRDANQRRGAPASARPSLEIGLPPGAEVDQGSLERTGPNVYRYEVQPGRAVSHLSPFAHATVAFVSTPAGQ